ncbi:VIT1/CCC1 family predicted Fe2+/Mn2+ transporter [Acholeplasma morum]|nr:VIT1/CCC1 family predicted Fe2+/Mn2+ transporter [Paracholeplasma morum]
MNVFIQGLVFVFYILCSFSMIKLIYILLKYNRYVVFTLPCVVLVICLVFFGLGWFVDNEYLKTAILLIFVFLGSTIASIEKYLKKD